MLKARLPKATGRTATLPTEAKDPGPILVEFDKQLEEAEKGLSSIKVRNDKEYDAAGLSARTAAQITESLERQRKEFVQPLNDHVKLINSRFKPPAEKANRIVIYIKGLMKSYHDQKRIAAEAEARRIEEEQRKKYEEEQRKVRVAYEKKLKAQREKEEKERQAQLEAARKAHKAAPAPPPAPPPPPLPEVAPPPPAPVVPVVEKTRGNTKVSYRWTFEVTDMALIPREFLEVNNARVRRTMADKKEQLEAGKQPVTGIRFYKETNVAV